MLIDFLRGLKYGNDHRGVIFRRTYNELEELQIRAQQIYHDGLGAEYIHSGQQQRTWTFPSGSTLKMRYLERDADVHAYQGHQYSWIAFDELTNWPTDYCYVWMLSCARSAAGAPVRIRSAGNPGSKGHVWVKARFVDVAPPETLYFDPETELTRIFIPAKLDDNEILMLQDPDYEKRLKALPSHLYRAYREGDWDIFVGQVFEELRKERHQLTPIKIDPHWFRFASFDWGYAKPFSIGWWAVTNEGRMIRYREWYGCEKGKHDLGIRMASSEVARKSWEISVPEGCEDMVADPAIWSRTDDNPSVADQFAAVGWVMHKANNDRIQGLIKVHDYLRTSGSDGKPMMMVVDTCKAWWRTMPILVADEKHPEDIDTNSEDHAYDDTRYAAMSKLVVRKPMTPVAQVLHEDQWERQDAKRAERYDPLGRNSGRRSTAATTAVYDPLGRR